MVCIPCIVAPILLFVWYKFIQPIVLKIWNPWGPQKSVKNSPEVKDGEKKSCPFSSNTQSEVVSQVAQPTEVAEKESASKKID